MKAPLARIAHQLPAATADKAALTRLFSTFDLDVTRHAVGRKSSNKYRHSNLLHRLATKPGERCGLGNEFLEGLHFCRRSCRRTVSRE